MWWNIKEVKTDKKKILFDFIIEITLQIAPILLTSIVFHHRNKGLIESFTKETQKKKQQQIIDNIIIIIDDQLKNWRWFLVK